MSTSTTTEDKKDHWSSEAYQSAAAFVPKLATKVIGWLDAQPDDVILDLGCGDGVINVDLASEVLSRGTGRIHGTDASASMIAAAKKAAESKGLGEKCTFEESALTKTPAVAFLSRNAVVDATALHTQPHLQSASFTKAFSNAAMHWILRPEATRATFFRGVREALQPGGTFTFELGGLGNVVEMRTALLMAVARRAPGGLKTAMEYDPWFFPDEAWVRKTMEDEVGGWKVEKVEREYRPTPADPGASGVEGWVRLMGANFFEAIPDAAEKEEAVREVVEVLNEVCRVPGGGWQYGYVRLRATARKL
ncbi:S-adenosyl-L-methionine-dependent methyltransferase [Microdochium trichocladiopsis]|uniref:S-adenosyl-L-methionine-dependent methyltransferase n=1 Tax=Microdochium trichocladiopsis TaxID=1682393 RepID=A0A9P8XWY9_9PEZI|nr:S-adenosyl-L-methionine-dependent methyltransferase [Microdochium trichocladiopsis]KAH7018514.1 S-adenosyl-L-methionine-dependent methyltransferase [Microdochium trichocladiopsis]